MNKEIYAQFGISTELLEKADKCLNSLEKRFKQIDEITELNQLKVLGAFQKARVSEACMHGTTGYGYGDLGRDTLEEVYSYIFNTEAALVRPQITCGTHALALALMSNLRPGDELLCPAGKPYDTLDEVIGIRESRGSLAEYGITYRQVDLKADGSFDYPAIKAAINEHTRLVEIQRSRGYATRPTFSVERIGELITYIKNIKPDVICMVDNCYGEFVQPTEPSEAGADMCVGSLIKNPGGGIAPIGGYIAGKREYVEQAACRLTSPGLGKEVGASLEVMRSLYQGLFLAPGVSSSALKTALFASYLLNELGYRTYPSPEEERYDIIQEAVLETPEKLIAFCRGIQEASPVDSYVVPEPWDMPGYNDQVIMAAGTFISGSSIELSADGPLKPPYSVYFQGGLNFAHGKAGILKACQRLIEL